MSTASTEIPNSAPAPASGSALGKLAIAGIVAAVVLAECGLAYLLIPSADQVAAEAAALAAKDLELQQASAALEEEPELAQAEAEIDLGRFGLTSQIAASNLSLRIDFQLYGLVLKEDQAEFEALLAEHQHRFREQVMIEVRDAELADLADPRLALIKRRILEKSNALLGKPLLRSVVFSDYSFLEQ